MTTRRVLAAATSSGQSSRLLGVDGAEPPMRLKGRQLRARCDLCDTASGQPQFFEDASASHPPGRQLEVPSTAQRSHNKLLFDGLRSSHQAVAVSAVPPPDFLLPAFPAWRTPTRCFRTSAPLLYERQQPTTTSAQKVRQRRRGVKETLLDAHEYLLTADGRAVSLEKVEVEARRLTKEATYSSYPVTVFSPEQKLFELLLWLLHQRLPLKSSKSSRLEVSVAQALIPLPSWARLRRSRMAKATKARVTNGASSEGATYLGPLKGDRTVGARDALRPSLVHAKYDELLAMLFSQVHLFRRPPSTSEVAKGKQKAPDGTGKPVIQFFEANVHSIRRFARLVESAKIRGTHKALVVLSRQLQDWTSLPSQLLLDTDSVSSPDELAARARRLLTHVELVIAALLRYLGSDHFHRWRIALLGQLDRLTDRLVHTAGSEELRKLAHTSEYFRAHLQVCCRSRRSSWHDSLPGGLRRRAANAAQAAHPHDVRQAAKPRDSSQTLQGLLELRSRRGYRTLQRLSQLASRRREAGLPPDAVFFQRLVSAAARLVWNAEESSTSVRLGVATFSTWRPIRRLALRLSHGEWQHFVAAANTCSASASTQVRSLCALIDFELRMHESLVADARRSRRARPSRPEPDLRRLHSLVKTLGEWLSPLRELGEPLLDLSSATPDDQLAVARSTRALARAWRLLVRIHLSRHRARQAIVTSRKLIGLNVSAISDFTHGSDLVEIRKAQRSAVIAMLSQVLRFESRAQRLSYGVKVLRVAQEGITNGVWDVTSFEASSAVKRGVSGLGDARENDPRSDLLRIWARVLGALAVDEESAVPRGLEDVLLQSIRSLEARVITLLLSNGSDLKQGHAVDGPWARRMRAWRTKMRQIVFRDVGRLQRLLASSLQSSNVSSTPGLVNVRIEAGTVPMPTNDSSAVNDRLRRVMQTLRLLHPRAKDIALLELALQGLLLRSCKNADSLQRAFKDELQRWHSTSGSLEASSGHVTPTELAVEGHRASVSTQIRKISDGIEQQPIANALASDAVAVRQEESSWATDMTGWPSEDGCGQRHSALKNLEPKLDEDVHKADQSGRHRTLSHRRSPVSVPHSALSPWKRSLLDGGGSAVASPRLHSLNTVSNLVDASWKDHGGKGGRGQ